MHIGVQIAPNDPFWVQVNEIVRQELAEQFVPVEVIERGWDLTDDQMEELSEEILSNEFDAFICMILPDKIINRLLENGLPVICVEDEIEISHPLFSSVRGWYDAGQTIAQFLAESLHDAGNILCLTGNAQETQNLDFSRQRLAGIHSVLGKHADIKVQVVKSYWDYETAVSHLTSLIKDNRLTPPHAILGLSDSLAFAIKHASQNSDFITDSTLIAGINGEPTALSEILKGSFQATVNISAEEFAGQAVTLAKKAAQGKELPPHFTFATELVTQENVAEISIQKLDAISNIPSRLVGINRKTEENRLIQYEITSSINQKMAVLQDKEELVRAIAELLRVNYEYSRVNLYSVSNEKTQFTLENPTGVPEERLQRPVKEPSILREVYENEGAIFVADVLFSSNKFAQEPRWKEMRSRAVLPIRFGEELLGLLDLQSDQPKMHLRNELIGLQLVADQIGVALHNAALYEEAIQARAAAEKANQLKTRLLANVSHELRAPLNVILGYCQAILANPDLYHTELPSDLFRDLGYIFSSGEHLIRLINDLLDVSRAEIGALELFIETVSPEQLLRDTFGAMVDPHDTKRQVDWQIALPTSLPLIKADPVRIRQIIINLLSNAKKFTQTGLVILGADVQTPYLHIWVKDTGPGIPEAQQQNIFEPFLTANSAHRHAEGIGLGLNITRRLVLLHGGKLTLDSTLGDGSTFHVYLPLPNLSDNIPLLHTPEAGRQVMLGISSNSIPNPMILEICAQQNFEYFPLRFVNDLTSVLEEVQPVAIAWDMADYDPNEWIKIEQIRGNPDLNRIPFLVYNNLDETDEDTTGVTNILMKPVKDQSLYEYLAAFRPEDSVAPILVVDDEPQTRTMYRNLITNHMPEFDVIEAKTGQEAIDKLAHVTPSLIVLDLMMPEVDGFKVLEVVRAQEETRQIPVIVISGKVLTFEDVQKLDYANVIYQKKNVLTEEEAVACFQRVFGEEEPLPQATSILVKQALAYLQQNYQDSISRQEIATAVNANASYLSRIFSQEVGITLWDFLARLRMQVAQELLLNYSTSKSITDIAMQVGYNDPAYFCKVFKKHTGLSPKAYRKANGITTPPS